jgi:hypothetical protein
VAVLSYSLSDPCLPSAPQKEASKAAAARAVRRKGAKGTHKKQLCLEVCA